VEEAINVLDDIKAAQGSAGLSILEKD